MHCRVSLIKRRVKYGKTIDLWSVCCIDAEYRVWHLADFRYKEDAEMFAKYREEAGLPTQDQDMKPHTGQCPWPTKEAES